MSLYPGLRFPQPYAYKGIATFGFWLSKLVSDRVWCVASFFFPHHVLQHHRNMIKTVKMTPIAHPSKGRLAGHSNQIKKAPIFVGESLKLRLYCRVKKPPSVAWRFPTMKMKAMWSSISKAWSFTWYRQQDPDVYAYSWGLSRWCGVWLWGV